MQDAEDLLLIELRKFECELGQADLYCRAEDLIQVLKKNKKYPPLLLPDAGFHVEVVDAKRQLMGAIESGSGCAVYCEALLRLLPTKHSRQFTTTSQLVDALETCLLWLERQVEKDLDLTALFPLFSSVFKQTLGNLEEDEEQRLAHSLISRLSLLAMGLFSGKLDCDVGLIKVWRALVDLFHLCGEDSQQVLLEELHQAGVAKCSLEPKTLASFPVYLVESTGGGEIKIDFVSLLALSLLQCGKGSRLVPRFVEVLAKQCQAANQVANKADRNKSWSVWMKLLAKDCLAVLRCPEFPLAEQLALTLAAGLCAKPLNDLAAIDVVAMVLAALERDSQIKDEFAAPKPAPEALATVLRLEDVVDSQETVACPCKMGFTKQFLIDCFRCHRWFHGQCVGVDSQQPDLHSLAFTCTDCQVFALLESAVKQQSEGDEEAGLRTEEKIKHQERALIARHLQLVTKRNSDVLHYLALNSYDGGDNIDGGNNSSMGENVHQYLQPLTRSEASKLYRMVANLGLGNSAQRQKHLAALLKTLRLADSAITRCHTIKQLAVVFEANPLLFENALVKRGTGERLQDKSILVREACLDLVAKSIHSHEYREVVLNSVHDDGVSVRKRAIKLISDIILREDEEDVSPILIQFSVRLDDFKEEEAVKTTVGNALHQFFLKASPRKINLALSKMSQKFISFAWLESSLCDAKLQGKFRSCCELAMGQLGSPDADKLMCIKLCRVFAKFLTTSELKLLVAYIAPKPADEIAFAVCEIFVLRGEDFSLELGSKMETLSGNLQRLVMGCKPETLPSVVKAISSLGLAVLCASLWKTFTAFLEQPGPKQVDHCQRAILVLSLLTRYGGFPPDLVSHAGQLILPYAHPSRDVGLRKYSLQAAAWLLVRSAPEQYAAISNHIYPLLHHDSQPELKIQALSTLYDILIESDDQTNKSEMEVALLTDVVTCRLGDYLLLLRDDRAEVRLGAVKLLHPLLKRQTIHPQQVAAQLLALLRDSQLHDAVLDVLREAHERNKISHTLLYQGIIESHVYCHLDSAGSEGGELGCFSDAYFLFMGNVRNERKAFLSQLVNAAFEKPESTHFLCQVMARLPYQSYYEVVLVVQLLRKRGVLLASALRDKLDGVFGPVLKDRTGAQGVNVPVSDPIRLDCASSVYVSFALSLAKYLVKQYRVSNTVLQQNAADNKTMLADELTAHQQHLGNKPLDEVSFAFSPDQLSSLRDWSHAYSHLIRAMKDGGDESHRGGAVLEDPKPKRKRVSKAVADEAEDDEAEQVASTPKKPRPKRGKLDA
ncbi:hypothetical protein BASA81_000299 [Batrachochytrium salamandrivorans]|nr:hypothetical protein BASA81_000299 [Batrachochytrium salamandrivorans]